MKHLYLLAPFLLFAMSVPAHSAADAASAPAPSASTAQDCAKPIKPHDHGAERGMPTPARKSAKGMADCGAAPDAAENKGKAKPLHDHGKMHKNS